MLRWNRVPLETLVSRCLFVLLLAGCTRATGVHPDGKSEQDFYKDVYQCEQETSHVPGLVPRNRMKDNCLRAKGWRPEQR